MCSPAQAIKDAPEKKVRDRSMIAEPIRFGDHRTVPDLFLGRVFYGLGLRQEPCGFLLVLDYASLHQKQVPPHGGPHSGPPSLGSSLRSSLASPRCKWSGFSQTIYLWLRLVAKKDSRPFPLLDCSWGSAPNPGWELCCFSLTAQMFHLLARSGLVLLILLVRKKC